MVLQNVSIYIGYSVSALGMCRNEIVVLNGAYFSLANEGIFMRLSQFCERRCSNILSYCHPEVGLTLWES